MGALEIQDDIHVRTHVTYRCPNCGSIREDPILPTSLCLDTDENGCDKLLVEIKCSACEVMLEAVFLTFVEDDDIIDE